MIEKYPLSRFSCYSSFGMTPWYHAPNDDLEEQRFTLRELVDALMTERNSTAEFLRIGRK